MRDGRFGNGKITYHNPDFRPSGPLAWRSLSVDEYDFIDSLPADHPNHLHITPFGSHPHDHRFLSADEFADVGDGDRFVVKFANQQARKAERIMGREMKRHPEAHVIHKLDEAITGYVVGGETKEADILLVRSHPDIFDYIEEDFIMKTSQWGLDRIDDRDLPLDQSYDMPSLGADGDGIDIYIVDTGIYCEHNDFVGRCTYGRDFTNEGNNRDGNGHGTHVAGTAAGPLLALQRQPI